MDIKYYLQRNLLSKKEDAYAAHIKTTGILDTDGLIRQMKQKGTTFSEAEIGAFLVLLDETVREELAKGQTVKLSFATLRLSIGGVFIGLKDRFNRSRHKVKVTATSSATLNHFAAGLPVERVSKSVAIPILNNFLDISTGQNNTVLSPGRIGRINGSGLFPEFDNPKQGLFLVSDDEEQEIRVVDIETHSRSKIVFIIPELPASTTWYLELRRAYGRSGSIIRAGRLQQPLQVS